MLLASIAGEQLTKEKEISAYYVAGLIYIVFSKKVKMHGGRGKLMLCYLFICGCKLVLHRLVRKLQPFSAGIFVSTGICLSFRHNESF